MKFGLFLLCLLAATTTYGQVTHTWVPQPLERPYELLGVTFVDSAVGTAVGLDAILRTNNGGETWFSMRNAEPTLFAVDFIDRSKGIGVGSTGTILTTTNGGVRWTERTSGTFSGLNDVACITPTTAMAVGAMGVILRSTNGGNSWTKQSSAAVTHLYSVSFTDENHGVIVGSEYILYTTDGGTNWMTRDNDFRKYYRGVSFSDKKHGTAVGNKGLIARSTNGGITWDVQNSGTTRNLNAVAFTSAMNGTAVGDTGTIVSTTDGGETWFPEASGTTSDLRDIYFTDSTTGHIVGFNGTMLRTTAAGATSMVLWEDRGTSTGSSGLLEASPNPSSTTTSIEFLLAKPGAVMLDVLDLAGNVVAVVIDRTMSAGRHSASFETRNLQNGVYLFRLRTEGVVETKQLFVAR